MSTDIRVLLAEDMHLVRGALVALLDGEPDITVVAEVSNGMDVLSAALEQQPEVAVLDFDLPGRDGLSAAAELKQRLPGCRTLILTGISRPGILRRALAGDVQGFLLKDAPPDRLADAIRQVARGERVIDPKLAAATLTLPACPLTPRELDVLRSSADGDGPREIAARLHLTPGTVRNYLTAIVMKLDARNKVDAARIAREADWI